MTDDDRVRCVDCANLIAMHCTQPKPVGLADRYGKAAIGPELSVLLQRCHGFRARRKRQYETTRDGDDLGDV